MHAPYSPHVFRRAATQRSGFPDTANCGYPSYALQRESQQDGARRPLVLCISSDPATRVLVARLSKHWSDVALFLTESGRRGRRLALSLRPCLIVIDDQLSDFDGLDLLQQLRHVSATASTPIITVAAHPASMDRFIQAGATVWVEKPAPTIRARR